jgi:hypothetical protein
MPTECTQNSFAFHWKNRREVVARFDGGVITSDGGGVLLREVEKRAGIARQFAACFTDHRNPALIEDLNDHDDLRRDPLLATLVGKADPTGRTRVRTRDAGKALAGKSTLNRLELTRQQADGRYKKIVLHEERVDHLLVDLFLQAHVEAPPQIILDLDATDDPLHGKQEGRFFHGYYGCYCYLPLYIFCGEHLLCARLRRSDIDASAGALEEVERIVDQIRALMAWCEEHGVDYVFGLAKNTRLRRVLGKELHQVEQECARTGKPARLFKDFTYRTRKTWTRLRRVVGKAEHLADKSNPRFVVTSLSPEQWDARALYEDLYCARGDMENRIKEQQLYLFADRTSAATMRANQIRLWFSSIAYVLLQSLRRLGLKGTALARAQCHTIRLKLLKIGAQIRVTVRKVWVSLASSSPYADLFAQVYTNLRAVPLRC